MGPPRTRPHLLRPTTLTPSVEPMTPVPAPARLRPTSSLVPGLPARSLTFLAGRLGSGAGATFGAGAAEDRLLTDLRRLVESLQVLPHRPGPWSGLQRALDLRDQDPDAESVEGMESAGYTAALDGLGMPDSPWVVGWEEALDEADDGAGTGSMRIPLGRTGQLLERTLKRMACQADGRSATWSARWWQQCREGARVPGRIRRTLRAGSVRPTTRPPGPPPPEPTLPLSRPRPFRPVRWPESQTGSANPAAPEPPGALPGGA